MIQIDFNGMSTCLGRKLCSYLHFLCSCFLSVFFFAHGPIKCENFLKTSIQPIDGILTDTNILVRVDQGVIAPEMEPHHQMHYIQDNL